MYLMYVDESGDPGLGNSPTRYFILSGLVIHELRWKQYLDQFLQFRRRIKGQFGLKLRTEIHAAHFISSPGPNLIGIKRYDRLAILRAVADEIACMPESSILNVVVDKQGKPPSYDVFERAWTALLQRFENTIIHRNFPGPKNPDERGLVFPDNTDNKKITRLLRKMRHFNPVPTQQYIGPGYRQLQITNIIEDPNFRNSTDSYFIQATDTVAYLLYQHLAPNSYFRKKAGQNYFLRLEPVLCKVASSKDPYGIVRL